MNPGPDHVLVTPDPDVQETETKGGLVIQTSFQKRSEMEVILKWGTVVKLGNNILFPLKEGQRVGYNPYDSYRIEKNGEHIYDVVKGVGIHAYE